MTAALATPTLLIILSAIAFMILERAKPGRELPNAPRALATLRERL